MISGKWQNVTQKAVRWTCGACGRGGPDNIQPELLEYAEQPVAQTLQDDCCHHAEFYWKQQYA